MFRKENGVTLVALVITIIVLLILAGVTISMVLGDKGIIAQASGASIAQTVGSLKDSVNIGLATMRTEDVAYAAGVAGDTDPAAGTTNSERLAAELVSAGYDEDKIDDSDDDAVVITIDNVKGLTEVTVTIDKDDTTGNYSATYVDQDAATL